ncbi:hypothetical protein B5X24_HaOG214296 [Helicoverpa armigera]|nr:hypothetical protein B5X24_HaOG214296 [Helicoverpa armigera]
MYQDEHLALSSRGRRAVVACPRRARCVPAACPCGARRAGVPREPRRPPTILCVSWDKVVSDDPEDPVIGYTAYLWEIKQWTTMEMNYLTGELEEIENEPKMDDDILPDGIPMIVTVSANDTYAPFRNLKRRVCYEIRVKAFTKTREGPFSSPTRHKARRHSLRRCGNVRLHTSSDDR